MANKNEKVIWKDLMLDINNEYGVAGLMGNLFAESGLMPNNLENRGNAMLHLTDEQYTSRVDSGSYSQGAFVNDGMGYGLAQWTFYSRKQALYNHCKAAKKSIGDLNTQLDFLVGELRHDFPDVWSGLCNATSIKQASVLVLTKFEMPGDMSDGVKYLRNEYSTGIYNRCTSIKQPNNGSNSSQTTNDTPITTKPPETAVKSITDVAKEVISGKWGNGNDRAKKLKKAGYDYNIVQAEVNRILNSPTKIKGDATTSAIYADMYDPSRAGKYIATTAVYMRDGAGTFNKAITIVPEKSIVTNFGYYSYQNNKPWLYVQAKIGGKTYTGFVSSSYLAR